MVRSPQVITIKKGDQVAGRQRLHTTIAGGRRPGVLRKLKDTYAEASRDFKACVRGAVIDNQHFIGRHLLPKHGAKRLRQEGRRVEAGNDYTKTETWKGNPVFVTLT